MFKLYQNMSAMSLNFSLCAVGLPCFTKKKQGEIKRFLKIRLQQHSRIFSSALVRTVFFIRTARFSHPH